VRVQWNMFLDVTELPLHLSDVKDTKLGPEENQKKVMSLLLHARLLL
jgi:hypothetical protein